MLLAFTYQVLGLLDNFVDSMSQYGKASLTDPRREKAGQNEILVEFVHVPSEGRGARQHSRPL